MLAQIRKPLQQAPVLFEWGPVEVTETVVITWAVMLGLVVAALFVRRRLNPRRPGALQIATEGLITWVDTEIRNIVRDAPHRYFPLIATMFVFILLLNLVSNIPGVQSPTGDLSTTAALAVIVFFAVPVYGIAAKGVGGYLKTYLQPTPFMLPLNIITELSRTLALAVRLFGNVMSAGMIVGILLLVVPLFVPVVLMALGLITGVVQAYIFPILAMVYIGGAVQARRKKEAKQEKEET